MGVPETFWEVTISNYKEQKLWFIDEYAATHVATLYPSDDYIGASIMMLGACLPVGNSFTI